MARELGLNPDKLGKIDNHRQEPRKAPLPQFIEDIYFKRFKREEPETVRPLKQILKAQGTGCRLFRDDRINQMSAFISPCIFLTWERQGDFYVIPYPVAGVPYR